jgi:hypothetical protein
MRLSNPEENAVLKMACLELNSRKSSNIINTYNLILFAVCAAQPMSQDQAKVLA